MSKVFIDEEEEFINFLSKNRQIANYEVFGDEQCHWGLFGIESEGFSNIKRIVIMGDEKKKKSVEFLQYLHIFENLKDIAFRGFSHESIPIPPNLTSIELLDISMNYNIINYPEHMTDMKNLKILRAFFCPIDYIPYYMTSLEKLEIVYTKCKNISCNISELTNLKKLSLVRNSISCLPESIAKLQELTFLDLDNNDLEEIPDSVCNLLELVSLNVSSNNLTSLNPSLSKLTNLTQIKFNKNHDIKSFPEEIDISNFTIIEYRLTGLDRKSRRRIIDHKKTLNKLQL